MTLSIPRLESLLWLGTTLLLAGIAMFASTWVHYIRASDVDWDYVRHTREVIQKLDELKISLLELENSERGYLITGRDALLERNVMARESFNAKHNELSRMVADNAKQIQRANEIKPLFAERLVSNGRLVELRDNYGLGAAQPIIVAGVDQAQSDRIDSVLDDMLAEEFHLLDIRRTKLKSTLDSRRNLSIISVVIMLSLLAGLGFAIRSDLRLRAQHVRKLDQSAHSDMLTGLANRRYFVTTATSMLALAQRNQKMAAVLMMDLDGFKGVNDTLGHEAGDILLRKVADRLKENMRDSDLIARLGGDEFVIMLPEVSDLDGLKKLAQKLIDALAEEYMLGERLCNSVGASIGLAWSPDHGDAVDTLMRHADLALYAAKRAGKRQYALYESRMSTE